MGSDIIIVTFLSIVYGFILLSLAQYLLFKKIYRKVGFVYLFYVFFSIIYHFVNIEIVPDFYGFTGGFRVGTDDCRFYFQISSVRLNLPMFCQTLGEKWHNFSIFLKVLYPFPIIHPLQIVSFNCIGIALIPILGKFIYLDYFPQEKKKAHILFALLLLSPSILANGTILMRDGWTAQCLLMFIYCMRVTKSNNIVLVFLALLLVVLRPSFFIFPLLYYYLEVSFHKKNFYLKSTFLILLSVPIIMFVSRFLDGGEVGRSEYVNGFLSNFKDESIFYKIMNLPFPLNIILSFLFFFTSPFLNFKFFNEGTLVLRNIFNLLEALIMIILIPVFVKDVWKGNDKNSQKLLFFVTISILLLATLSLQFRHKIVILPFLYMILVHVFKRKSLNLVFIIVYLVIQLIIVVK